MRLPLTVRWTDESVVGEAATESREVSSRGLYFHLPKGLKSGSPVEIVMTLPHELTQAGPVRVRCLGRVLRSSPETRAKWEWPRRSSATSLCVTANPPLNEFLTQTLRRWVRRAGRLGSLSLSPRLFFCAGQIFAVLQSPQHTSLQIGFPRRRSLFGTHPSGDDFCAGIIFSAYRGAGKPSKDRDLADVSQRVRDRSLKQLFGSGSEIRI